MATIRTNPYLITLSRIGGTFIGGAIVNAVTNNKLIAAPVMALLFAKAVYDHALMVNKHDLYEDMVSLEDEELIEPKNLFRLVASSAVEVGVGCFAVSRFVNLAPQKDVDKLSENITAS